MVHKSLSDEIKGKRKYTVTDAVIERNKLAHEAQRKNPQCKTPEEIQYNSRLIDYVLKVRQISKTVNIKDPETIIAGFYSYLELSQIYGFKISNLSACAAIGIDRQTLTNWLNGKRAEYREIAETIRSICDMYREPMIADNKLNPVIGIFWQRNYDGLRNDTEQIQPVTDQRDNSIMTPDDYRKLYGDLLKE